MLFFFKNKQINYSLVIINGIVSEQFLNTLMTLWGLILNHSCGKFNQSESAQ
jgi:hypothetical protein